MQPKLFFQIRRRILAEAGMFFDIDRVGFESTASVFSPRRIP